MSDKCYSCGQMKKDAPTTLKGQWLAADLPDKVMSLFFGAVIVGITCLMLIGLTALVLEVANSY